MPANTQHIKLPDTRGSRLPLGFRKIHMDKIPPLQAENKLMLYNHKYRFQTMQVLGPEKPVSKILH